MNAPVLASQFKTARFTVAQIWALVDKGLIAPKARFELLDGEVVPMSPKGPLHEDVRYELTFWLRDLPRTLVWLAETTLYLDEQSFLEPDYVVFAPRVTMADFKPADVLLAIEVAHESWRYDTGEKAERYAAHGVQEYWVIHAAKRIVRVHRQGGPNGWAEVTEGATGEHVAALCAPDNPFRLPDLA